VVVGRAVQPGRPVRALVAGGQLPDAGIVDVARLAGVSVATVSRALRALPNVAPRTRERVLEAAATLQYTVSPLGAGLATGRVRAVGVVMPYVGRWFFAEVIRGIESTLRAAGYDLVLHALGDADRRQAFFGRLPVRRRVDAVLVVGLGLTEDELAVLHRLDLPLACVGEPMEGVHGERIDNVEAGRIAVQHLIDLGHRDIAMIAGENDGPHGFNVPALRARGFEEALAGAGLTCRPDWVVHGDYTADGGEQAMHAILASGRCPTAVFCQSDEMAFGAMRTLRTAGLDCPGDVSVIGVDDHELARTFELTTVAQPVQEQGAAAAAWLVRYLEGHRTEGATRVHPARLVVRSTTRRPDPGRTDGPLRDA
jgi:LacI family repressor for deo operon, udp, cdd, tsx, nupC, and nupG